MPWVKTHGYNLLHPYGILVVQPLLDKPFSANIRVLHHQGLRTSSPRFVSPQTLIANSIQFLNTMGFAHGY